MRNMFKVNNKDNRTTLSAFNYRLGGFAQYKDVKGNKFESNKKNFLLIQVNYREKKIK